MANLLQNITQGFENVMMNPLFQMGIGLLDEKPLNQAMTEGINRASGLQQVASQRQQRDLQAQRMTQAEQDRQRQIEQQQIAQAESERQRAFQEQFANQLGLGDMGLGGYLTPTQVLQTRQALTPEQQKPLSKSDLVQVIGENGQPQWVTAEQALGMTAPAKAPLVNVNTGEGFKDVYGEAIAKKRGERDATMLEEISKGGTEARQQLSTLQTAEELLNQGTPTGFGEETLMKYRGFLDNMGLPQKNLSKQELLSGLSSKLSIQSMAEMGGGKGVTDKDMEIILSTNFGLSKSEKGNRLLIKAKREIAKRKAKISEITDKHLQKYNTPTAEDENGKTLWDKIRDIESKDILYNTELGKQLMAEFNTSSQQQTTQPQIQEGRTAINQQTGERMIFRGGQWQKM